MIKKYKEYVSIFENDDISNNTKEYPELTKNIKEMIEQTIENSGGEYSMFIDSYIKSPEDVKIEGLINDSDIYDFYIKYRNEIDELLNDVRFFDTIPSELNVLGLYEYIITGTNRSITEIVQILVNENIK
ncbi:MAG: hypothetical protein M0R46_06995 [Candidatus Muirbacterium halophilum]|nr:hypothetical protein [Candidatus Muirbacterium halophilum]